MKWIIIYLLMFAGMPILYFLLLYRLQSRMSKDRYIVLIFMVVLVLETLFSLLIYAFIMAILDTLYDFFKMYLMVLAKFYIFGIITIGLYVHYYILIKKDPRFINSIISTTIIVSILIFFFGGILFKERERGDDKYTYIQEVCANNADLVGLSKEEVIELLGEPYKISQSQNMEHEYYKYSAGNIYIGIILGKHNIFTERHEYRFTVHFDKTNKVVSTSLDEIISD